MVVEVSECCALYYDMNEKKRFKSGIVLQKEKRKETKRRKKRKRKKEGDRYQNWGSEIFPCILLITIRTYVGTYCVFPWDQIALLGRLSIQAD